MWHKIIIIGVIAAICALWAIGDYSWHYPQTTEHADGAPAVLVPNFSFRAIGAAHTHPITDFKGKTVLVNFWASWCAPCLAEFPKLAKLARENPKTLVLILMSEDETSKKIYNFTSGFRTSPNAYIAWDDSHRLAQQNFQTYEYPETFVVSPDQMINQKFIGEMSDTDMAELQKELN